MVARKGGISADLPRDLRLFSVLISERARRVKFDTNLSASESFDATHVGLPHVDNSRPASPRHHLIHPLSPMSITH